MGQWVAIFWVLFRSTAQFLVYRRADLLLISSVSTWHSSCFSVYLISGFFSPCFFRFFIFPCLSEIHLGDTCCPVLWSVLSPCQPLLLPVDKMTESPLCEFCICLWGGRAKAIMKKSSNHNKGPKHKHWDLTSKHTLEPDEVTASKKHTGGPQSITQSQSYFNHIRGIHLTQLWIRGEGGRER